MLEMFAFLLIHFRSLNLLINWLLLQIYKKLYVFKKCVPSLGVFGICELNVMIFYQGGLAAGSCEFTTIH